MESAIETYSTSEELAQFINEHPAHHVGIVADTALVASLLQSLPDHLAASDRKIAHIPAQITSLEWLPFLEKELADLLPASPPASPMETTAEGWRDRLTTALREEQRAAQERLTIAKQSGANAESFDRDVAGWLAAGLIDLFADKVTGATYLVAGKGAIARLADDAKTRFTESDFLRPDGIKFLEASRPAQSMLTKLSLASTTQFRTAAARLMNQTLEKLPASVAVEEPLLARLAKSLQERNETLLVLIENADAVSGAFEAESPIRLIAFGPSEGRLREWLSDRAILCHYIEKPAAPPAVTEPVRPAIMDDLENLLRDLHLVDKQVQLFQLHGAIPADSAGIGAIQESIEEIASHLASISAPADDDRSWELVNRGQELLSQVQQSMREAWPRWFANQLATIDAEWFLQQDPEWDFLDIPPLMEGIHKVLLDPYGPAAHLPESEHDWAAVEKLIAELKEIDRKWRNHLLSPVEEGMAFDAAVAAGGAPLNMLTKGVRWWIGKENRDWKKYRIVRVD